MGVEYTRRLGYDSGGLKSFLEILNQSQPGKDSVFLSTHPSPADRLSNLSTGDPSGDSKQVFTAEFKQATQGKI